MYVQVLHLDDTYGRGGKGKLLAELPVGVDVLELEHSGALTWDAVTSDAPIVAEARAQLERVKEDGEIRLGVLFTLSNQVPPWMRLIYEADMLDGWIWILSESAAGALAFLSDPSALDKELRLEVRDEALTGMLGVWPRAEGGPLSRRFDSEIAQRTDATESCGNLVFENGDGKFTIWKESLYDSVLMLGHALRRAWTKRGEITAATVYEQLNAPLGAFGPSMWGGEDGQGQILGVLGGVPGDYEVVNIQGASAVRVGSFAPGTGLTVDLPAIRWPGKNPNATQPPVAVLFRTAYARQFFDSLESAYIGSVAQSLAVATAAVPHSLVEWLEDGEREGTVGGQLFDELDYFARRGAHLVVLAGSDSILISATLQMAVRFPDSVFALLDASIPASVVGRGEDVSNALAVGFFDDEMAFVIGVACGSIARENAAQLQSGGAAKNGVVGALWGPQTTSTARRFRSGFRNGVRFVCDSCVVLEHILPVSNSSYSPWTDEDTGRAWARQLISGAEYAGRRPTAAFAAAGGAGSAFIVEAAQSQVYVFGVDTDEYVTTFGNGSVPGVEYLLGSGLKNFELASIVAVAHAFPFSHISKPEAPISNQAVESAVHRMPLPVTLSNRPRTVTDLLTSTRSAAVQANAASKSAIMDDSYVMAISNGGIGFAPCRGSRCNSLPASVWTEVGQAVRGLVDHSIRTRVFWDTGVSFLFSDTCPAGTEYRLGAGDSVLEREVRAACTECVEGQFSTEEGGQCESCPDGALCPGGTTVLADVDHWQSNRANSTSFYRCPAYTCCVEGSCSKDDPDRCPGGRQGILCSDCPDGQSLVSRASSCVECNEASWATILVVTLVCLTFITVLLLRARSAAAENATFAIAIDGLQLMALAIDPYRDYTDIDREGGLGSSDISISGVIYSLTNRCIIPMSPMAVLFLNSHLGFLLAGILFLLFLTHRIISLCIRTGWIDFEENAEKRSNRNRAHGLSCGRCQGSPHSPERRKALAKAWGGIHDWRFVIVSSKVVLIIYAAITRAGLELLICRHVDGENLVAAFPSVRCQGIEYIVTTTIMSPIAIFFATALPLLYIFFNVRTFHLLNLPIPPLLERVFGVCLSCIDPIPKKRRSRSRPHPRPDPNIDSNPSKIQATPTLEAVPETETMEQESSAPSSAASDIDVEFRLPESSREFSESANDFTPNPSRDSSSSGAAPPGSVSRDRQAQHRARFTQVLSQVAGDIEHPEQAELHREISHSSMEVSFADLPRSLRGFAPFWIPFRGNARMYYYGLFYFRRAVAVVIVVTIQDRLSRQLVYFLWMVCLLLLQLLWRPYVTRSDNHVSALWLASVVLTSGMELAFQANRQSLDTHTNFLVVELFFMILPVVVTVAWMIVRSCKNSREDGWNVFAIFLG